MLPLAARAVAAVSVVTWWVFPGFGLVDLSVTWDRDWPVVLEASWGVVTTVLVGGAFLVLAVRPSRGAPAMAVLGIAFGTLLLSAAAGLEWQLLGYAALLAVEAGVVVLLLGGRRERLRPLVWRVSPTLLALAVAGVLPWLVHADQVFGANRAGAGVAIGDVTMGVDHYAVQGAFALGMVALPLLAAVWPRGRRHLAAVTGLTAGYVGVVSYAHPATWAGFGPTWSVLCTVWALAVGAFAVAPGSRAGVPADTGGAPEVTAAA